jgi:hypothetical protein
VELPPQAPLLPLARHRAGNLLRREARNQKGPRKRAFRAGDAGCGPPR